jgi:hypothetical protein
MVVRRTVRRGILPVELSHEMRRRMHEESLK